MTYDLTKTQFLIAEYNTRAFKRKRTTMLFNREGKPARTMTYQQWQDFQKAWPKEIAEDGLTFQTVWTLVEIQ